MTLQRAAIILSAIVVLGIGLSVPAILDIPSSWAAEPCCSIVGIQPKGLVTAQERVGARCPFQFQVNDPALLRSPRVGQPIQADLTTMRVSVGSIA